MNDIRQPFFIAIAPPACLVIMLAASVAWFGGDAAVGPAQIALIVAGFAAGAAGVARGVAWRDLEDGVAATLSTTVNALYILLLIGALIGVWISAGIIPTLIVFASELIHPKFFYVAVLFICAITSLEAIRKIS